MSRILSRSAFTAATAAAFAGVAFVRSPARAAQFSYKLGHSTRPTENLHLHLTSATDAIRAASGGRLDIQVFPSGQLGTDAATAEEVRSGAVQMAAIPAVNLQESVPLAGIDSTAFAFRDHAQAQHAMDGPLGDFVIKSLAAGGYHIVIARSISTSAKSARPRTRLQRSPTSPISKSASRLEDHARSLQDARRFADADRLERALRLPATKLVDGLEISPSAMLGFQVLRSAEISGDHEPRVERLLVDCESAGLERSAARSASDCDARVHDGDHRAAQDMVGLSQGIIADLGRKGMATNTVDPVAMRANSNRTIAAGAPSSARPRGRCSSGRLGNSARRHSP